MRKAVLTVAGAVILAMTGAAQSEEAVTLTKQPVFKARKDAPATEIPSTYKPSQKVRTSDFEPLRGPWRVTKSLKDKGKEPVDENGNTYACVDKDCKVSRKVDEKRD
ncbi:hypothetical protein [Asticcacaulis sp.]|uniref:hypothetical protein n=1 Tax=Asticcacaulis sp. TaxID=1872648 RepID=UPI0031D8F210